MFKKVSSAICLFIFTLSFSGVSAIFFFHLSLHKYEQRQRLQLIGTDKLERITLSQEEFEDAFVEDNELKIRGKMFDIVYTERTNDSLIVFGVYDEEEDNLLTIIQSLFSEPLDENDPGQQCIQLFTLVFVPAESALDAYGEVSAQGATLYTHNFHDAFTVEISKPPRL